MKKYKQFNKICPVCDKKFITTYPLQRSKYCTIECRYADMIAYHKKLRWERYESIIKKYQTKIILLQKQQNLLIPK